MLGSIVRTALLVLAAGTLVEPHTPGFCPIVDTSDTGGGALGCAIWMIIFYLAGQLLFAVGSIVPGKRHPYVPLVPCLHRKQRYLVAVGAAVTIIGVPSSSFVSSSIGNHVDVMLLQTPALLFFYYTAGWSLMITAWVWRGVAGAREWGIDVRPS